MLSETEKKTIIDNKGKLHTLPKELQDKMMEALSNKQFSFEEADDIVCCDTGYGPHGFMRISHDDCINYGGTIVSDDRCPQ